MTTEDDVRVAPGAEASAELAAWAYTVLVHRIDNADVTGRSVLDMLKQWAHDGHADYAVHLERRRLCNEVSHFAESAWSFERLFRNAQAIVDTIPWYERQVRQIMVDVEASGLLADEWELDRLIQRPIDGWAAWTRRKGSGWLHIIPPNGGLNLGATTFRLDASFRGITLKNIAGVTAVDAVVAAIVQASEG